MVTNALVDLVSELLHEGCIIHLHICSHFRMNVFAGRNCFYTYTGWGAELHNVDAACGCGRGL